MDLARVDFDRTVATCDTYARFLTERYLDGDRGEQKAADIHARYDLSAFARTHAHGDSREDRPMPALAHERWYGGRPLRAP